MPEALSQTELSLSTERFRRAHFQGLLQDWLNGIAGRKSDLFNYEEVRSVLEAREGVERAQPQDIPLSQIVGSVGRYRDFTQTFLPRNQALLERWRRVDAAMNSLTGLPPVDLYQVGDVYFVRDGNHRVSVARSRGDETIEAYVTPVQVPFPVEAASAKDLDRWLLTAGQRLFFEHTRLHDAYPEAEIKLTEPDRYRQLREQIEVHGWYLGEAEDRPISYEEAARSWYEHVYLPLTSAIEHSGIMSEFPDRTVADLFLWICYHREELNSHYNLQLDDEAAVSTFASVNSDKALNKAIKSARLAVAKAAGGDNVILGLPKEELED